MKIPSIFLYANPQWGFVICPEIQLWIVQGVLSGILMRFEIIWAMFDLSFLDTYHLFFFISGFHKIKLEWERNHAKTDPFVN